MNLGLSGLTAIACASTSGLGRAVAESLAAEGANVVISGRRGELAQKVAASMRSAIGVGVDLTTAEGPGMLVSAAVAAFGQVDIVVLNGPGPKPKRADEITVADLTAATESLLLAHQRLIALTLPAMRKRGCGRILAIGSSGVVAPLANMALSNIGRGALAAYLKTLATEVASEGVTVNLLLPGRIATKRVAELDQQKARREGQDVEHVRACSQAAIPAGRYGTPAEFGAIAAFLCSQQASYVTGTAMRCDGGLTPVL